jgi:hypothetical protein
MDLAGVRRIDVAGAGGEHVGSQTIRSDPDYERCNRATFVMARDYYVEKWGGTPGQERYASPFGNRPLDYWVDLGDAHRRQRAWHAAHP